MSISKLLQDFEPISLKDLNNKAELMKRQETKYLCTKSQLAVILEKLSKRYYLLEIDKVRLFLYDNMYMDNQDLIFYHDHENGKDVRMKLRKRKYVDTKQSFVEYKVKSRAVMDKKRLKLNSNHFMHMDQEARQFFNELHKKNMKVVPTMQTTYNRITLCSKTSEERLTIDVNLVFSDPKNKKSGSLQVKDFVIIEVKQKDGSRSKLSKNIIENAGGILSQGCSKYCLGLIYFGKVKKFTHFQDTVNFIEEHGGVKKIKKIPVIPKKKNQKKRIIKKAIPKTSKKKKQ